MGGTSSYDDLSNVGYGMAKAGLSEALFECGQICGGASLTHQSSSQLPTCVVVLRWRRVMVRLSSTKCATEKADEAVM
ncbi:expansin-A13, partial [Sesbania bispinosa]